MIDGRNALLYYERNKEDSLFYQYNCFSFGDLLEMFEEDRQVEEVEFLIQRGYGETYEAFYQTDFPILQNVRDMKSVLEAIGSEAQIFTLSLVVDNIKIGVDEEDIYITIKDESQHNDVRFIATLFEDVVQISKEKVSIIMEHLLDVASNVVEINEAGDIAKVYGSPEEAGLPWTR